ncbi:Cro/CI family transcriptional regulator [Shewanella abyssi]|uniref:Cro/CI family transcriptional regulator n=1 Tax=Shewanella abyssi TaxID=311789 RepID=UPI00200F086E|nr:Cro/CI family transcriptional regulator [Shewanella abyssi]MCL1048915.1 Cro/CI family transcriptional regulator [Shewanella abyssi]
MKTKDAISYFGNKCSLAGALKLSKSAISQWPEDVPELRAYQIERLTNGELTAVPQPNHSDNAA